MKRAIKRAIKRSIKRVVKRAVLGGPPRALAAAPLCLALASFGAMALTNCAGDDAGGPPTTGTMGGAGDSGANSSAAPTGGATAGPTGSTGNPGAGGSSGAMFDAGAGAANPDAAGGRGGAGAIATGGAGGASAGSGGAGAAPGTSSGGGGSASTDARPATDLSATGADAATAGGSGGAAGTTPRYECSQFMGPNITADWFTKGGFEPPGDQAWNDAWQVKAPHAAFADLWANPDHDVWKAPVVSPCAPGRKLERVVFVTQLSDWTSNMAAKWKTAIDAGIKTIRAKHPTVKRIDLVTFYRSIDNKPCPSPKETWVPAAHDDAHTMIAAESGGGVVVGPIVKVECSMFAGPPYLTAAGHKLVAEEYRKYYAQDR